MRNDKDNDLIFEAYLAEKVTELTDAHLAYIRSNFFKKDKGEKEEWHEPGDAEWNMSVIDALKSSFNDDQMYDDIDPGESMPDNQWDAISKHLSKLKHGSTGSFMNRGTEWVKNSIKNTGDKLSRGVDRAKKELGSLKLQSPITRKKRPGKVYLETYEDEEDISEDQKMRLRKLQKDLFASNAEVFKVIHDTMGDLLFLTKFLPTVMYWLQYSSLDAESLMDDVVGVFDAESMQDAMAEIFFSSNYKAEFSGVMETLRRTYTRREDLRGKFSTRRSRNLT